MNSPLSWSRARRSAPGSAGVRRSAGGEPARGIPRAAADIVERYAPLAAVMGDFAGQLQNESRLTPFPDAELRLAQEGCGMPASR
ncbi:hypothetical protein POD33_30875 [Streptomyces moderatus]|nr:hypothetical protein POD33_30875 [Streptomyces moderatus]